MDRAYLAFDLGAESGRAVLAHLRGGILSIEDVHRFANEPVSYGNSLHWDLPRLWLEIQRGLSKVAGTPLESIGVDTWAVDYALLGEGGELLENPYHYRDRRTNGMMEEFFRLVPRDRVYATTGIQFMPINTLYQLFAATRKSPGLFRAAQTLLTIPDLLNFWLTGERCCEFTNASTTQLMDAGSRQWSPELFAALGLNPSLAAPIVQPGVLVGTHGGVPVIAPATHDTGSAVAAVSPRGNTAFLSSGTWSLLGLEVAAPVITPEALRLNFTNEGGVCGTTRLLKNVMGLWLLQSCRKAWTTPYEYPALIAAAEAAPAFAHAIDPDHPSFLNPPDMPAAIDAFCLRTAQPVPASPAAYTRAILESLACRYRAVLESLEHLTGQPIHQVRIIGGGCQNRLLNQFTADATGRRVLAGPVEATALGNLAIQMLATGAASSLEDARAVIDRSFPTEIYEPQDTGLWNSHFQNFQQYTYA